MRRILLVDDHPLVRQGIKRVLTDALPDLAIGEADDCDAALAQMRLFPWDVVVLDVTLPGPDGLAVLKKLRTDYPAIPVLMLSMHPADQFARRTMAAGAAGYITKDSEPSELVHAVALVLKGQRYLRTDSGTPGGPDAGAVHQRLSDREYQVLRMIAAGRTVSQIASELSLSVKTVSTYRARILEKMELTTNAELMHYAMLNHLVL